MKRILSLWLAALMFAAQTGQAAVCVGFGQSAACSGNYGTTSSQASYSNYGETANTIIVGRVSACSGGTVASLSMWSAYFAHDFREAIFVIYSDNAGEPGTLLWNSSATYGWGDGAVGLKTVTVNQSATGDYLWIGMLKEYSGSQLNQISSGGATRYTTVAGFSTGDLPSSWPTSTDSAGTATLAAYITY